MWYNGGGSSIAFSWLPPLSLSIPILHKFWTAFLYILPIAFFPKSDIIRLSNEREVHKMKLRPVTEVAHISILKVVEELFIQNSSDIIKMDFAEDCDYNAQNDIKQAICHIVGFDDTRVELEDMYKEEDVNELIETVFDIVHNLVEVDKECE